MLFVDPRLFLEDPDIKFFTTTYRVDLTAADVPTQGTGRYIIAKKTPSSGKLVLVKALTPFVDVRTDVGTAFESFRPLTAQEANGQFLWEPLLGGDQPPLITADLNAPRLSGAAQNTDRSVLNGIVHISESPWEDAAKTWGSPFFVMKVENTRELQVVWSILPVGAASPIPYRYAVGGGAGLQRVDFAGVVMSGVELSKQKYDQIAQQVQAQAGVV